MKSVFSLVLFLSTLMCGISGACSHVVSFYDWSFGAQWQKPFTDPAALSGQLPASSPLPTCFLKTVAGTRGANGDRFTSSCL